MKGGGFQGRQGVAAGGTPQDSGTAARRARATPQAQRLLCREWTEEDALNGVAASSAGHLFHGNEAVGVGVEEHENRPRRRGPLLERRKQVVELHRF